MTTRLRVAVTGATGHVGLNAVRALTAAGHKVRAIIRKDSDTSGLKGFGAEHVTADVLDPDSLRFAVEGSDAVVHLAGRISIDGDRDGMVWRTNVEGTTNVAEACLAKDVRKLVHVSSIHAFAARPGDVAFDETAPAAGDDAFAYDRSKAAGERAVREIAARGLNATILNPTGILGPHDNTPSLGGNMLREMFRGRLPLIVDAGFDWVDARDVASAIVAATESWTRRGEGYLLSGHWAKIADLAEICDRCSGQTVRRRALPVSIALAGAPFLKAYAAITRTPPLYTRESVTILRDSNRNISSAKAAEDLGFAARPLEETILDTYAWNFETKRL